MKKFLLPIALALAILLTLTSCDALVGMLPEGVGDALQNVAPGIFGEKDDPEANIALIVSTINEGKDFESVLKEQEKEINIDEVLAELEAELAALTCEVNFKANADGEKVSGYGAIKDKVMYLEPGNTDEQGYIFIEDDYKLVAVSGSKENGYHGTVTGELAEYIEMLKNGSYEDAIEDELDNDQAELIESLMSIKLPQATLEDVIYDPATGRYYISDSYMESVIDKVAEDIVDAYIDVYPDEVDEDIYDSIEEGIADTLDVVDIKLWYYVVCEEFTGMGISVESTGDLCDINDSFDKIKSLSATIDANNDTVSFAFKCEGEESYELVDVSGKINTVLDEEGEIEKCHVEFDAIVPFNEYEYSNSDYYYNSTSIYIYGLNHISFNLDMDLANLEGNGNVLSASYTSEVSDIVAYTQGYSESKEHYSSDYTAQYSKYNNETEFSLSIVASEDGNRFDIDLSAKNKDKFNDINNKFTFKADLSKSADNMPSIPSKVERARKDALNEYEDRKDQETTPEYDDDYDYDYGW